MGKAEIRNKKREWRRVKRKKGAEERDRQEAEKREKDEEAHKASLADLEARLAEKERELQDSRGKLMVKENEFRGLQKTLAMQPHLPKLPKIDPPDLSDPTNGPVSIGAGNFGAVELKRLRCANNCYVAVKTVGSSTRVRADLQQEADLLSRVCHRPWFPFLFGWNPDVAEPYLVQEFVSSTAGAVTATTLMAAMIEPAVPLLLKTFEFLIGLAEVARGLVYLHSRRILHNDIKNDNILLHRYQEGRVMAKIIDFGSACWVEKPISFNAVCGGESYHIAPEVARGGPVTTLSDIFSFGVLMKDVEKMVLPGNKNLQTLAKACCDAGTPAHRPQLQTLANILDEVASGKK